MTGMLNKYPWTLSQQLAWCHQWRSEGPAGPATAGGGGGGGRGAERARQGPARKSYHRNPLVRGPNKLFAGARKSSLRYWVPLPQHGLLRWSCLYKMSFACNLKELPSLTGCYSFKNPPIWLHSFHAICSCAITPIFWSICVPLRKTSMAVSFSSVASQIWNALPGHLSSSVLQSTSQTGSWLGFSRSPEHAW